MSGTERDIRRAREATMIARAQLADTMSEIQLRLNPRTLINDAWLGVRDRGEAMAEDAVNLARARPFTAAALVAAVIAFLAREPIWNALSSLLASRRVAPAAEEDLTTRTPPSPPCESAEAAYQYKEIA